MIADLRYDHLRKFRYYFDTVAYSVYYVANLPLRFWDQIYRITAAHSVLKAENESLRVENALLNSKLQELSIQQHQEQRLKQLLQIAGDRVENIIVAELIAKNSTPFKQRIIVNKGRNDEARVGQIILGARGILGQIISISPFSATGMLISDPAHSMLTQVKRSQIYVLTTGIGNPNRLQLQYIPSDADIREGDTLVTSGLDDLYPPDYPVGKVVQVIRSPDDAFATVFATPAAKLNQGREVLLATGKKATAENTTEKP